MKKKQKPKIAVSEKLKRKLNSLNPKGKKGFTYEEIIWNLILKKSNGIQR